MSLARNTLRRTLSLFTILVLLLGSGARANAQCAREALASFGPLNPYGFPGYYVDQNGLALTGCIDPNDPMCVLGPLPDPGAPLDVASGNFHEEFFYWLATATVPTPGGDAILVLGIEGAWGNETIIDGNQVGFSRYRVRVDVPPDPSSAGVYTVTHPFGVSQFEVTDVGTGLRAINSTEDCLHTKNAQGVIVPTCGPPPVGNRFITPLDPTLARISRYLSWDPAESAPPQGYLGNPLIPHTITGSPCGTNFFRVEGPGMPPGGVETNLFTLMGKRVEICGNGYLDVNEQCDDGNTANGDCCSSTCQFESADTACDDGNPCTDNSTCDGAGTCQVVGFNTGGCDDGNACTISDQCSSGACVGGPARDCEDSNECTDDSCDPVSGCQHSNNTSSCDDGNACTTADTCNAGACAGGLPPSCDDGNSCTEDSCSPSEGCTHSLLLDGTACRDGSACTQSDTCQAGVCVGSAPVVCSALDQCHEAGTCDPATGTCSNPNKTDGTTCNDADACTQNDTCQAGEVLSKGVDRKV